MSKKPDLSGLINRAAKESKPAPVIQEVVQSSLNLGRKRDFAGPVKKTTITMQESTYDALRLALASTHKQYETQNKLMDAALRAFLGLSNT